MVTQLINPARQAKKRLMERLGLKTGKQYHKWLKKERKLNKEEKVNENYRIKK